MAILMKFRAQILGAKVLSRYFNKFLLKFDAKRQQAQHLRESVSCAGGKDFVGICV